MLVAALCAYRSMHHDYLCRAMQNAFEFDCRPAARAGVLRSGTRPGRRREAPLNLY